MDKIDIALRFYTQLIQSKVKRDDTALHSSNDEQIIENNSETTMQPITPLVNSLCLTKDLLSSYYNLHRQYQRSILRDDISAQQEQVQVLFETEWKKIDILQLKHDYDQLKQEHQSFNEKVEHLRQELQQTQLERDHYRRENIQIVQDIERLKVATPTNVIVQSAQVTTSVPIKQNSNNQTGIIDQLKDLLPQQITPDQAKSFIEDIYRRRTEFDDEDMRKSICGSLKRLGSDLYSSSVHFLHELIQNAEDNTYVGESRPYLRIELNHDYILFSNNEQGLRPRDVLAICSLAVTTKTSEQKHIGEKGVGFKSVFAASNRPMLFSHSWKFRFQVPGTDAMSYITPLWINDQDIPQYIANQISANRQHTHLYLPLKLTPHTDLAKQFLDDVAKAVDPCILLNMRKLQKVEVVDQREEKVIIIEKNSSGSTKLVAQHVVEFEGLKFLDLVGLKAQLSTLSGKRTFRVYTCQIDVPSAIEERTNPMTMLTLAFPCEYDYDLTATVYNGLPVCDLGFKFMFNAEFHLVTSRENVRENVPLNTYLRDHLAVLFVYLLLNDTDLKKDISHYCPSSNIHQVKHSSWWRSMIGRINQLIENHLSILFDIGTGKEIRSMNPKISSLISKEQLYDYANIQVIDSNDEFFTTDRLKSLHIQTVSIKDVLKCFPNRHEPTNDFLRWTQKQDQQWWSHFFHHLSEEMTSEVSDLILQKPIFFLQDHHQRQYLPKMSENSSLLYINDDRLVRIWKRRLTILQYASTTERTALIRSGHVKSLTEQELIDIIQIDHLQLSIQSMRTPVDDDVLEEIWKDLSYLQSRIDKLDRAKPLLVPIQGSSRFTLIQNTTLPTFFGRDMRFFMDSTVVMFVHFPYYEVDPNSLVNNLQWEYFLLKMQCKPPSINLPQHYTTARLPCLPSFTMFTDENIARFGEFILSVQQDNTQQALRQFPIIAQMNSEEQLRPIETTFDQSIITDLPSLPRIDVPSYCRSLAMKMGVSTDYDLNTCVSILQYLGDEKITNVDLYIEWLGRLQLEVRQNNKNIDKKGFRSTCQLYLPDKQQFCSLKHLLVMSEINDQNREGILLVCKYLKLQLISLTTNQTYWQFRGLFHILDCQCSVSIENIYRTICLASNDKHNFYPLGNRLTTLKPNGLETMITLFQYLEHSIGKCVADSAQDSNLYRAVITNKHPTAHCGSREDLQWRFGLTSTVIVSELKKLTNTSTSNVSIPLLTFDDKMIAKTSTNIIYACLEIKIIQNLSRARDKRHFISPDITQKCPLVLALFGIDYVERRGKVEWTHTNINMEYHLSQLTRIFRETTSDHELEVVGAKYAHIYLLISDAFAIDTADDKDIYRCQMETDYPFLIINKTVLLCTGNVEDDSSRAIIAISALATLLHKRQQHLPFDEAKLTARQKIVDCNEFLSRVNARVACAKADLYPYVELLFPTDHESLKSIAISISGVTRIEQDAEENLITLERSGVDELFRIRAEKQDHRFQQPKRPDNWTNPSIVDGEEHIRIGQNAEHFFFDYLQRLYGTIDVQPTNNWRSSARLVTYPQYTRDVNDSAGYDLELHDTMELFTKGTKSRTKKCYFEVKGTSGSFHEEHTSFHISQNEQEKCKSIADDSRRREQEAYFLVIIEHCLDPEKIALAKILDWSSQFHSIELIVDGYQCRFLSTPPIHITHGSGPQRQSDRPWRSPRLQHEQTQDFRTGGRERGSTVDRS
ncbi:unnamed protein product, partial [Rotaria sp. Silwood1]